MPAAVADHARAATRSAARAGTVNGGRCRRAGSFHRPENTGDEAPCFEAARRSRLAEMTNHLNGEARGADCGRCGSPPGSR